MPKCPVTNRQENPLPFFVPSVSFCSKILGAHRGKPVSPPSDYRRALRPPQFTLRTLIGLITLLAALFSLVNVVHPVVMAGLVLLALLIAAHVAGNVIGTRLREIGDRPVTKEGREVPPRPFDRNIEQSSFAPPSDLARRISLGLPILIVTTAGVLTGGIGGGLWGYLSAGERWLAEHRCWLRSLRVSRRFRLLRRL